MADGRMCDRLSICSAGLARGTGRRATQSSWPPLEEAQQKRHCAKATHYQMWQTQPCRERERERERETGREAGREAGGEGERERERERGERELDRQIKTRQRERRGRERRAKREKK